jgi:hypothetical protein
MRHQERNSTRWHNPHKAEHLRNSKQTIQWWPDYLDGNRCGFVSLYGFSLKDTT